MENSTQFNSGLFIWHQFRTAVASFTLFYKVKNGENPPENQTTPIEQAQQRKNLLLKGRNQVHGGAAYEWLVGEEKKKRKRKHRETGKTQKRGTEDENVMTCCKYKNVGSEKRRVEKKYSMYHRKFCNSLSL